MKKKIFLHAGTHKTGTTTIQNFLYENSKVLKEEYGYDYLINNTIWKGHHGLGWMFNGNFASTKEYCHWYHKGVINYLEEEIRSSNCNNFIISSENLFRIGDSNFAKRFFDRFSDFEVFTIIYLRDHESFLKSYYTELVFEEYARITLKFEDFIDKPMYPILYSSVLNNHIKMLKDKKHLIVKSFNEESKNNGLIMSFLNSIGIRDTKNLKFIDRQNVKSKFFKEQIIAMIELNKKNFPLDKWYREKEKILNNSSLKKSNFIVEPRLKEKIYEIVKNDITELQEKYKISFANPAKRD